MSYRFPLHGAMDTGSSGHTRIPGLPCILTISLLLAVLALPSVAQTVSISSPPANSTVSGTVHVQASAKSTTSITVSKIYLDGSIVFTVHSNVVDTILTLSTGKHRLTVWAYDSSGRSFQSTVNITSSTSGTPTPSDLTVFSRVEEQTEWQTCGNCGNSGASGATATYHITRGITSPSKDGSATEFSIGGSNPFKNGYWYIRQTAPTAPVQYLKYEFDLYVPKAYVNAPQAIEFECQQKASGYKYNFAWQANYPGHSWRIFDYVNRKWDASGLRFDGFTPDTWHHIIAEYHTDGKYVVHDALTVDGVRKVVNSRHAALASSTGRSFTNAFQLDLNGKATDYKVYVDGMKVSYNK